MTSYKLRRPGYDRKLRQVESQVADLDAALRHVKRFDCVVQAGGAYGLWPLALSERFNTVYTFEPDCHNFPLLAENTAERVNVIRWQAALGSQAGFVAVQRDDAEADNAGAGYVVVGGKVPVVALDTLCLPALDFLCLDVEGYELEALTGAIRTIRAYRPVVMLESKRLPHMTQDPNAAVELLLDLGYEVREKVNRDVVLTC